MRFVPRTVLRVILGSCFVLFGPADLHAQRMGDTPAEIVGRILDGSSREPLAGASAILRRVGDHDDLGEAGGVFQRRGRVALSDSLGRYRFQGLPSGMYRITVERLGYHPKAVEVELRGFATSRVTLGLTVAPITLEPLSVTFGEPTLRAAGLEGASRSTGGPHTSRRGSGLLGLDAHIVSARDVESTIAFGEPDLFRALQRLPGAATRDGLTAEIWTRGAHWSQTRVYFDGLPLFDPVQVSGVSSGVAPEMVDAVAYLPGARPARLGAGIAGAIDLRSRVAGKDVGRRVSTGLSALSARASLETRFMGDRGGLLLTRRRSWWDLVAGSDPTRSPSGVDYVVSGGSGTLDYNLSDRTRIVAGWMTGSDRLFGSIPGAVHQSQGQWGNSAHRVGLETRLGEVGVRIAVGESGFEASSAPNLGLAADEVDPDVVRLEPLHVGLSHSSVLLEVSGRAWPALDLDWTLGAEFIEQTLNQTGAALPLNAELASPGHHVNERFESFAQVLLRPLRDLQLRAGARVGVWSPTPGATRIEWAPRLVARVDATDRLVFSGSIMRSHTYVQTLGRAGSPFGAHFFVSQAWTLAGPDAPAAESDFGSLALELDLGGGWTAMGTAWTRRVVGEVFRDVRPGFLHSTSLDPSNPALPFLVGRSTASGLEGFVRWTGDRTFGSVAYSYTDSEAAAGGQAFRAPSQRTHVFNAMLSSAVSSHLRIGAAARVASGARFTRTFRSYCHDRPVDGACPAGGPTTFQEAPSAEVGPHYATVDVSMEWGRDRGGWRWDVWVQLHNVLGRKNSASYEESFCVDDRFDGRGCVGPAPPIDIFAESLGGPFPVAGLRLRF